LKFSDPLVVTGEPVTVKMPEGDVPFTVRPTLETLAPLAPKVQ
jgi:hypothetical protein